MKLQTQVLLQASDRPFGYDSRLLLLGSCFAENIGTKLDYYKFRHTANPLGILFHPQALETLVTSALGKKEEVIEEVFLHQEQWHSFAAHSSLSHPEKEVMQQALKQALLLTEQELKQATHLFITLGTAWVYRYLKSDSIVANCHKIPQKEFRKELLSTSEIIQSLEHITERIFEVNPDVSITFTISPVRHLKDGFTENQRSKAHLITAVHQLLENNGKLNYFPAYELLMDELRDYRFYADDMVHPSPLAIVYVWERFKEQYMDHKAFQTLREVEVIQKGRLHRPFHPGSTAHREFVKQLEAKKEKLSLRHPHIIF